jgi:ABC-type transporter Mla MlaB component
LILGQGNLFVDLDLSGVTFADTAAVAVLCRAQRRVPIVAGLRSWRLPVPRSTEAL